MRAKGIEHYAEKIREDAHVTVFTATWNVSLEYPYRLGRVSRASPTVAARNNTYILDSDFKDESVTNDDVLERAEEIGADLAMPSDVVGDPPETTETTVKFLESAEESGWGGEPIIPLQDGMGMSHADHYHDVKSTMWANGYDIEDYWLSVGGLVGRAPEEQIKDVARVRYASDGQHLHALGVGMSPIWITAVQKYPSVVDSIDNSAGAQNLAMGGNLLTPHFDTTRYRLPRGKNSTCLYAKALDFQLHTMCYMFGPHVKQSDLPEAWLGISDEEAKSLEDELDRLDAS